MPALRNLRMMTRYTAWANERLFEALAELPAGEAAAKRPTLFGSMLHTMNHCLVIDLIWQAHLEGRPHGFTARNTRTHPPLDVLRARQAVLDRWYIEYADGLTPSAHDETVHFTFVDGGPGAMTRGQILLHVINHKTFHRGWVTDLFFQTSAAPPATDLPVFLRDARVALP